MIRLIHNLGGCGGTLLSRCLGVLPGVALLSEINPNSVKLFPHFDPLYQNQQWLHLLPSEDVERFSALDLERRENFRDLLEAIHARANAAGRRLLLRDYNYVDFIGIPYVTEPPGRISIYDALPPEIATAAIAFIRHPVDQWFSLCKHEHVRAVLTPALFCTAYAAFLRELGGMRIYKYEEFAKHPEAELRAICRDLDLPFDPSFLQRFYSFDSVTGDFARQGESSISAPAVKSLPSATLDAFRATESYPAILQVTGYLDPVRAA